MSTPEDDDLPDNVIRVDFRARRARTTDEPPATPGDIAAFPEPAGAAPAVEVSVRVELDPSEVDRFDERRREFFDRVIQHGMVAVTFDPRRPGVSVPAAFATRPELMLNFSLRFHIADFAWDERGLRASLSFDDGPFFCDIPWSAVWLMVSKPTYSAYAVPFAAPPERRGTIPGMLRSVRTMLEQLPPPSRG